MSASRRHVHRKSESRFECLPQIAQTHAVRKDALIATLMAETPDALPDSEDFKRRNPGITPMDFLFPLDKVEQILSREIQNGKKDSREVLDEKKKLREQTTNLVRHTQEELKMSTQRITKDFIHLPQSCAISDELLGYGRIC